MQDNMNEKKLIDIPELDFAKYSFIGNKNGQISNFNNSLVKIPVIYLNNLIYKIQKYINHWASIGEKNSSDPLLLEAGHYIGFTLISNILKSDEWNEIKDIKSEYSNSDNQNIIALFSVINKLGIGKWSLIEYSKSKYIDINIINPIDVNPYLKK